MRRTYTVLAVAGIAWAVGAYTGITEVARVRRELAAARRTGERDPLTGLRNRAGFTRAAEALLRRQGPWWVVLVDLDDFKPLNDNLGHAAGDQVLTEIGQRLGDLDGRTSVTGRLGGDEFAAVLSGADTGSVQAVRDRLAEPMSVAGRTVAVRASVGATPTEGRTDSLAALLACADAAMYRAKRTRTGVAFHAPYADAGWSPPDAVRPPVRRRDRPATRPRLRTAGEVARDAA